jgi:hypothetical protein
MATTENHHSTAAQNLSGYETADRQVEATLALAYEQRTANLIALFGAPDLANVMESDKWATVTKEILERLGL